MKKLKSIIIKILITIFVIFSMSFAISYFFLEAMKVNMNS